MSKSEHPLADAELDYTQRTVGASMITKAWAYMIEDRLKKADVEISRLSGENDTAYMSIDTMKARIESLEKENARLTTLRDKPHPASRDWSGDDNAEYHRGIGGGPGY